VSADRAELGDEVDEQIGAALSSTSRNGDSSSVSTLAPLINAMPSVFIEPFRYMVAQRVLQKGDEFPRRIAVTSPLHGEGVSTLSRALAVVLASDMDQRVCWVDFTGPPAVAKKRRGPVAEQRPGLLDVLARGVPLDRVIQSSADPRLSAIGAGSTGSDLSADLAHLPGLDDVLAQIERRFDLIVLDMPPVLAGSTALALMRHAEAYLLVVRHGSTSMQQVQTVANQLKSVRSLGVVLNQFSSRVPGGLRRLVPA
jgi:Mrp family chromosome partitioning ATPase